MGRILAVVSTDRDKVAGGAPIFIVGGELEQQQVAFMLEKILNGAAHDLKNGSIIIVQHNDGARE
jgi:hypothetical protein